MSDTSSKQKGKMSGSGEEQQPAREGVLSFLKHNLFLRQSDESLDNIMHQINVDTSFSIN